MSLHTGTASGLTVYRTLADRLRGAVLRGEFGSDGQIWSEHELARREGISRMTVRKASDLLINEGLLERRHGKGLFVRNARNLAGMTVQVVVGSLLWDTSVQMARGVQMRAADEHALVQVYDAHGDMDADLEFIDQLPAAMPRGR